MGGSTVFPCVSQDNTILLHSLQAVALCSLAFNFVLPQVQNILKYLFPVPKDNSKRVVTFANQEDYISFRYMHLFCVMSRYCTF